MAPMADFTEATFRRKMTEAGWSESKKHKGHWGHPEVRNGSAFSVGFVTVRRDLWRLYSKDLLKERQRAAMLATPPERFEGFEFQYVPVNPPEGDLDLPEMKRLVAEAGWWLSNDGRWGHDEMPTRHDVVRPEGETWSERARWLLSHLNDLRAERAKRLAVEAEPVETPADIVIPPATDDADALIDAARDAVIGLEDATTGLEQTRRSAFARIQEVVEHYRDRPGDVLAKLGEREIKPPRKSKADPLILRVAALIMHDRPKQTRSDAVLVLEQFRRTGETDFVRWSDEAENGVVRKAKALRDAGKPPPPPKPTISREKLVEALRGLRVVLRATNAQGEAMHDYAINAIEIDDDGQSPIKIVLLSDEASMQMEG